MVTVLLTTVLQVKMNYNYHLVRDGINMTEKFREYFLKGPAALFHSIIQKFVASNFPWL